MRISMLSHPAMRRTTALVLLSCLSLLAGGALADVVQMKDGRRLEGEILDEDQESIRIDAMVIPTIRATLTLNRAEIESIERKPVPEGFFDPPPADERVSKRDQFDRDDTPYLEIAIVGRFGEQVFKDGVAKVISYASRHRIQHIVFVIDSEGGDLDEVKRTYELLKRHSRRISFHALIRNCRGGALAIPVWCESIFFMPGATVGGLPPASAEGDNAIEAAQEQILRTQIAADVARNMNRNGGEGDLVRAMIDPLETCAAWRDEDGTVQLALAAPSDVPEERIIFRSGVGEVLVLSYDQAIAMGATAFDGTVAELGAVLELPDWKLESTYGEEIMAKNAADKTRRAMVQQAKYAANVETNIQRRETTERYIEENLRLASEWNPSNASYGTYSKRWRWDRGTYYRRSSSWSGEARDRWKSRTDATIHYLQRAGEGTNVAARLDRQAVELGLEPTFKPGELEMMAEDLQMKINDLAANRGRWRD